MCKLTGELNTLLHHTSPLRCHRKVNSWEHSVIIKCIQMRLLLSWMSCISEISVMILLLEQLATRRSTFVPKPHIHTSFLPCGMGFHDWMVVLHGWQLNSIIAFWEIIHKWHFLYRKYIMRWKHILQIHERYSNTLATNKCERKKKVRWKRRCVSKKYFRVNGKSKTAPF